MAKNSSKLVIFIPKLYGGGAESHFVRLLPHLNKLLPLSLYTLSSNKVNPSFFNTIHPYIVRPLVRSKSTTISILLSIPVLFDFLRVRRPDIVVTVLKYPSIFFGLFLRVFRHDYVHVMNIQNSLFVQGSLFLRTRAFFERQLFKLSVSKNTKILTISKGLSRELANIIGRNDIDFIYNVGLPDFDSSHPITLKHKGKFHTANRFNIISIGRLVPQKDYVTLFKSLCLLPKAINYHLTILGSGPLEKDLIKLCHELNILDRVSFLGYVSNPIDYLVSSDLFILSSLWEGFGNVIVEAMSCHLPVISTDCPHGPSEIIDNYVNGILVPTCNSQALSNAIVELYGNPGLAIKLADNAFEHARLFSSEVIAPKYFKYLSRFL